MTQLRFFVPGVPAPQGSKKHVGRGILIESSKKLGPWRDEIVRIAQRAAETDGWVSPGAVHVRTIFWLVRPRSVSLSRRPRPTVKPDLDKLVRAAFDALTIARVISDDAAVVTLTAAKVYCGPTDMPGVQVTICDPPEMA